MPEPSGMTKTMELIDTHAHLYEEQFSDDIDMAIKRAQEAWVVKILMPNVDRASIAGLDYLAEKFPSVCLPMMGLHPCYVKEKFREELEIVEQKLRSGKYFAVGETGLDYYWDLTFKEQQKESFTQQILWAKELQLPIVIHSRSSFDDIVEILKPLKDDSLRGVFHCFTGTFGDAQKVIELGFYMGIGGVVTFKNSGLDKVVEKIDLKHIVLETDSPYLAPVPHRGQRNEASYVKLVAEKIAQVKNITLEEVAAITSQNARQLFKVD